MFGLLQNLALTVIGLALYLVTFWPTHNKAVVLGIAGLVLAVVSFALAIVALATNDRFNFKKSE